MKFVVQTLVFAVAAVIGSSCLAQAQQCSKIFGDQPSISYAEYSKAPATSSRQVVKVTDAKGSSWKFWIGFSAKKYVEDNPSNRRSRLLSVYQENQSSLVYLLVELGDERGVYKETQLIEFNLKNKKSRMLTQMQQSLYSSKIIPSPDGQYVILFARYTGPARFQSYYFDYTVSKVVSTDKQKSQTIMHASSQEGATRWGRANLRHSPIINAPFHSITINDITLGLNSRAWIDAEHFVEFFANGINISKLNKETLKLDPIEHFSFEDIKNHRLGRFSDILKKISLQ